MYLPTKDNSFYKHSLLGLSSLDMILELLIELSSFSSNSEDELLNCRYLCCLPLPAVEKSSAVDYSS